MYLHKQDATNYVTTKGIILESRLARESDRMVSVFTEALGRVRAVAPGAARINARLLCATEPGVESDLTFYGGKNGGAFARITGGMVLRVFPGVRSDTLKYAAASKTLETINLLTPENEPNEKKYVLAARTLELLEESDKPEKIYMAFALRLLKLCGWGLELDRCVKCGRRPAEEFYLEEKGVLCADCRNTAAGGPHLNGAALSFLKELAKSPGDKVEHITVDPEPERLVTDVIESYVSEYAPRPLKSAVFA
jgi:DNA repair protein RecO (recombination protein O)